MELTRRGAERSRPAYVGSFALLALIGSIAIPVLASASSATTSVYVQSDDAVVRESPNAAARPLAHPLRGEELLSFGRRGNWVNVLIHQGGESRKGWILHGDVSESAPDPSNPPTRPIEPE